MCVSSWLSKVIPQNFYPSTDRFGGYSDEHGAHPSDRRHILIIFGRNVKEDQ